MGQIQSTTVVRKWGLLGRWDGGYEGVGSPSSRSLARPGSAPVDRTKSDRTASISRVIGSCRSAAQHSAEVGFGSRLETIHLWERREKASHQWCRWINETWRRKCIIATCGYTTALGELPYSSWKILCHKNQTKMPFLHTCQEGLGMPWSQHLWPLKNHRSKFDPHDDGVKGWDFWWLNLRALRNGTYALIIVAQGRPPAPSPLNRVNGAIYEVGSGPQQNPNLLVLSS